MKLISINVAKPRLVQIGDREVLTAIDKEPVSGRVALRALGLEGDGQADLSVHGGPHQAVYGYPAEHYPFWEEAQQTGPLSRGAFGENFTTKGLLETEVFIGDTFRVGSALLQVTAPRLPCFKFAHKIQRPHILKDFLWSGRCGFYFRVLEEGEVAAGDPIEPVQRAEHGITMRAMLGLQKFGEGDAEQVQRALAIDNLNPLVRADLEKRLAAAIPS